MRYAYYPGCSLEATGRPYQESVVAVSKTLGIELVELEDWNCDRTRLDYTQPPSHIREKGSRHRGTSKNCGQSQRIGR